MAQITKLNENNTKNGWIFTKINQRMELIEKEMSSLRNNFDVANSELNISLNDYSDITRELSNRPNKEYVNAHQLNHNIHVDETQKNSWNNKLDLRDVKHIEIKKDGNNISGIKFVLKDENTSFSIPVILK